MSIHVGKHTSHCHCPAGKALRHFNSGEMTLTVSENHTARHTTEVGLLQILFQEPIKEQIAVEILPVIWAKGTSAAFTGQALF